MKIDAGRLNRRVTPLRPTQTLTESGAPLVTFDQQRERWCSRLRFVPVAEEREPQRQANASVQLLLRLDAETRPITTEWRVRFDGAEMLVAGVDSEPSDGSLILTCVAVVP